MKPFDLEKALAGEPVVTRDGREVKQLTVFDTEDDFCVYGVVKYGGINSWTLQGDYFERDQDHHKDLFMKSKKVVKWVNLYPDGAYTEHLFLTDANQDASVFPKRIGNKPHRIEWEE